MATKEAAPKCEDAIVVCMYPDVCRAPEKPAPFQIMAKYSDSIETSLNVRIKGFDATTTLTRIHKVYNDEPGIGGGLNSDVNGGFCRPTDGWALTVRVNGQLILRHEVVFAMNCPGPEGPGNTHGRTVYSTGAPLGCVTPEGAVGGDTKPPMTPTPKEKGYLERAWDSTKEAAGEAWDAAKQINSEYQVVTRVEGLAQGVGGAIEIGVSGIAEVAPTFGITQALGVVVAVHGADDISTGFTQLVTGQPQQTLTSQMVTAAGGSPTTAAVADAVLGGLNPEALASNAERVLPKVVVGEVREVANDVKGGEQAVQQGEQAAEQGTKDAAEAGGGSGGGDKGGGDQGGGGDRGGGGDQGGGGDKGGGDEGGGDQGGGDKGGGDEGRGDKGGGDKGGGDKGGGEKGGKGDEDTEVTDGNDGVKITNPKPRPKTSYARGSRKYNQMNDPKRGGPWTQEKVDRAFDEGAQATTSNFANGNPATRYTDPVSGDFIVVDDTTGDIIQFGNKDMVPTDLPDGR